MRVVVMASFSNFILEPNLVGARTGKSTLSLQDVQNETTPEARSQNTIRHHFNHSHYYRLLRIFLPRVPHSSSVAFPESSRTKSKPKVPHRELAPSIYLDDIHIAGERVLDAGASIHTIGSLLRGRHMRASKSSVNDI